MIRFVKSTLITTFLCSLLLCSGCGTDNKMDTQEVSTQQTTTVKEENTEAAEENVSEAGEKEAEIKNNQSEFEIEVIKNNSWEQDGLKCAQFDGIIRNQSQEIGKDWKIVITVPEGASLKDSWNGNYELSDTTLTILPVDYNKELQISEDTSFGFILGTKEAYDATEIILNVGEKAFAMNTTGEKKEVEIKDNANSDNENSENTKQEQKMEDTTIKKKNNQESSVAVHGRLAVKGTDIVDKDGKNFQLKGISTHGLAWFPDYVNKEAFASLSEYGVNAIRLAMYTDESGGYCNGGDQKALEQLVFEGVEACKELGLYVIIDWHVLREGNPNTYKEEAKVFFDKVSKKYADYDNVIYEICNEPCNGTTWEQIKSYAEEVIPVIRNNDKHAIIIVGTPNWSQDVDVASQNPVTGYDNLMYAVHFYAATHKEEIRNKVVTARGNGLPVIVSECSICEASGNGKVDYDEANAWMQYINDNKMSMFAWNLSNKNEKSSLIKAGVIKKNDFILEDFSETGTWFLEQYSK